MKFINNNKKNLDLTLTIIYKPNFKFTIMKKMYLFLLMGIIIFSSCSDVKKADKLRLEHKFDEAAALYQKAADDGDVYAMWRLGNCYNNGDGVEKDDKKAYEWYVKAAKAGCEEAKADIACTKIYGWYKQKKDVKKGIKQLTELAKKTDNPYVIRRYAGIYWDGIENEIEQDRAKADSILNTIKDKNDPNYLWLMGYVYCYGSDLTDINEHKAIECWEKSFEQGESGSKQIAELYLHGGSQIEKDIDKAVEWYKKGIEVNGSGSMLMLADIFLAEDSALQKFHNTKGALELLKKSMKLKNADACDKMGCLYAEGMYVKKDDKEAFKYFKMADEYGSANGALNLGVYYLAGRGTDKDLEKTRECYERAMERGNAEAALRLAGLYEDFTLGKPNPDKSKEYLEKAVDLGSPRAYYLIAKMYYYGANGYPEDDYQAFVYFKKAADAGWIDAYEYLIDMYEKGLGCTKNPAKAKEYREKMRG